MRVEGFRYPSLLFEMLIRQPPAANPPAILHMCLAPRARCVARDPGDGRSERRRPALVARCVAVFALLPFVERFVTWLMVYGFGFRVAGLGIRISGFGFRVSGLGFRV